MDKLTKVTLLCTSDVHGFYMPWDYASDRPTQTGGLARISTIVNQIREENPHTVLIDNGDLIQGNSAEFFLQDEKYPGIEAINSMKYEIYNMGNHEFNFGMDHLIRVVSDFQGVAMMGNLYRKKNTMRFMNGIYYVNIGSIRIGFISLNTPLVRKFEAKRGNLKNFDVIDANYELTKLLEEVGPVDALIGLFHMGDFNENDIPFTGVKDLLLKVPGSEKIDAVFGGHMHEIMNTKIGPTYFLEPGCYGRGLSRLDLYFDDHDLVKIEPSVIEITDDIPVDTEIMELMKPYHDKLRAHLNEEVGYVSKPLVDLQYLRGTPQTRVGQSKIGDFLTDVMLHYSKADVVAFHFDNLYPEINRTTIKRKYIYNAYRYAGGEVTNYEITGKDLKDYMEWSAAYFNRLEAGHVNITFKKDRTSSKYSTFDIFGNIYYQIDLSQEDGHRIKRLARLDGSPIKEDDVLVLGLNKYRMDFLTSDKGPLAGRKFKQLWTSIGNPELGFKGNIRNMAIHYFDTLPHRTYVPKDQVRWKILNTNGEDFLIQKARDLVNSGDLLQYKLTPDQIDYNSPLDLDDELESYQLEKLREKFDIGDLRKLRDILIAIK